MRMIIISLLFLLFVNACAKSPVNSPALQESKKIVEHIDIIQEETANPIQTQNDYSQFYLGKSNFIYTAGVPIDRIINILKPINPEYFEGVERIEFIKTNKFWSNSKDGWYYSDSRSIRIFVDYESDEFLTRVALHELKHNYCLTKERDSFNKCIEKNLDNSESWDYCYHDEGCFLNTPIDKEYGFIQ